MAGDGVEYPTSLSIALTFAWSIGACTVIRPLNLLRVLTTRSVGVSHTIVHTAIEVDNLLKLAILIPRGSGVTPSLIRSLSRSQVAHPSSATTSMSVHATP